MSCFRSRPPTTLEERAREIQYLRERNEALFQELERKSYRLKGRHPLAEKHKILKEQKRKVTSLNRKLEKEAQKLQRTLNDQLVLEDKCKIKSHIVKQLTERNESLVVANADLKKKLVDQKSLQTNYSILMEEENLLKKKLIVLEEEASKLKILIPPVKRTQTEVEEKQQFVRHLEERIETLQGEKEAMLELIAQKEELEVQLSAVKNASDIAEERILKLERRIDAIDKKGFEYSALQDKLVEEQEQLKEKNRKLRRLVKYSENLKADAIDLKRRNIDVAKENEALLKVQEELLNFKESTSSLRTKSKAVKRGIHKKADKPVTVNKEPEPEEPAKNDGDTSVDGSSPDKDVAGGSSHDSGPFSRDSRDTEEKEPTKKTSDNAKTARSSIDKSKSEVPSVSENDMVEQEHSLSDDVMNQEPSYDSDFEQESVTSDSSPPSSDKDSKQESVTSDSSPPSSVDDSEKESVKSDSSPPSSDDNSSQIETTKKSPGNTKNATVTSSTFGNIFAAKGKKSKVPSPKKESNFVQFLQGIKTWKVKSEEKVKDDFWDTPDVTDKKEASKRSENDFWKANFGAGRRKTTEKLQGSAEKTPSRSSHDDDWLAEFL